MGVIAQLELGLPGAASEVASFLIPVDEPILVDCGAARNLGSLEAALAVHGLALEDIRHLVLTHIHLDHAGAAGDLVARSPELTVWVHRRGARHLIDPSRLLASAATVFGDDLGRRFGPLRPVPADRVRALEPDDQILLPGDLRVLAAEGHARHHLALLAPDGTCFAGDACGSGVPGGAGLVPEAPPPDIDVARWTATVDRILAVRPDRLAVSHLGILDDAPALLAAFRERLGRWAGWVALGPVEFRARATADVHALLGTGALAAYTADGVDHSYLGFSEA